MPQSGVTSVRSWYLTSFVILSFYCLSVCLTLLTNSNTNHIFLNGEYRRFLVLLLRAERRILYFVALAAVRCRFTSMRRFFVPYGSIAHLSTQLTSHTLDHCSRINDLFLLYRGVVGISLPAMESTGILDIPPHLTKWGNSSVHWTAPPSPKFQAEFCRCCSLG